MGDNVHVCVDICVFISYQVARNSSVLMGNGSHASICGIVMVDLRFTSGNIVQPRNVHNVHVMKKNLFAGSLYTKMGLRSY
jgi:hypothetical protein